MGGLILLRMSRSLPEQLMHLSLGKFSGLPTMQLGLTLYWLVRVWLRQLCVFVHCATSVIFIGARISRSSIVSNLHKKEVPIASVELWPQTALDFSFFDRNIVKIVQRTGPDMQCYDFGDWFCSIWLKCEGTVVKRAHFSNVSLPSEHVFADWFVRLVVRRTNVFDTYPCNVMNNVIFSSPWSFTFACVLIQGT